VILNGFHDTWPIVYPEDAFGLARTGQTVVNATDGSRIRLFVDDEPFDLMTGRIVDFRRAIDMRIGVLRRELIWESPSGTRLLIRSRRLASLEDRHLAAMSYEVTPLRSGARVEIASELVTHRGPQASGDPRGHGALAEATLVPVSSHAAGRRAVVRLATGSSGLQLACGMDHTIAAQAEVAVRATAEADGASVVVAADLEAGRALCLSKYVAYHWDDAAADDLAARVDRTLDRAASDGYEAVERAHRRHVADFWRRSDVEIDGGPELQQAVRFNLFQILQATARGEGLGVPAKGVTGRGYEGQYFWDTEIYVVPFLIHTSPERARDVLGFRCAMLDHARARARELGHRGALYPWRTIAGEEASAWYAAGTAQYHINADIAYALLHYLFVTGDLGFLLDRGAEVLIETARLVRATGLEATEVDAWRSAAATMHVPRHEELGIVLHDEHFLERERWDFDATPAGA
jgi:alpha,alpha-trehalose phosphorylase